jgi:hypothetical protein
MRKIFLAVVAALVSLFGLFGVQIHLVQDVNEVGIVAGLLILGVWIFVEFKKDWADFINGVKQSNQWGDPGFWTAAISGVLIPILTSFGVTLSAEVIAIASSILAILVPVLMSIFRKDEPDPVAMAFKKSRERYL